MHIFLALALLHMHMFYSFLLGLFFSVFSLARFFLLVFSFVYFLYKDRKKEIMEWKTADFFLMRTYLRKKERLTKKVAVAPADGK